MPVDEDGVTIKITAIAIQALRVSCTAAGLSSATAWAYSIRLRNRVSELGSSASE